METKPFPQKYIYLILSINSIMIIGLILSVVVLYCKEPELSIQGPTTTAMIDQSDSEISFEGIEDLPEEKVITFGTVQSVNDSTITIADSNGEVQTYTISDKLNEITSRTTPIILENDFAYFVGSRELEGVGELQENIESLNVNDTVYLVSNPETPETIDSITKVISLEQ